MALDRRITIQIEAVGRRATQEDVDAGLMVDGELVIALANTYRGQRPLTRCGQNSGRLVQQRHVNVWRRGYNQCADVLG